MNSGSSASFGEAFMQAVALMWAELAAFVPNLLAFLAILIVGYVVAKLASMAVRRLLQAIRFDAFAAKTGIAGTLESAGVKATTSSLVARLIFYLLMLAVLVSAVESLGLDAVSGTLGAYLLYVPNILGAIAILMGGLYAAQLLRDLVVDGAEGIGVEHARPLGSAAYAVLLVVVVTLSVGQLELETDMLDSVIAIVLITAGAAAAIAFGLGSRNLAGNVLSASYVREMFREGDRISVADLTGRVVQITPVKTEIECDDGSFVTVPNRRLIEAVVIRHG